MKVTIICITFMIIVIIQAILHTKQIKEFRKTSEEMIKATKQSYYIQGINDFELYLYYEIDKLREQSYPNIKLSEVDDMADNIHIKLVGVSRGLQ